MDRNLKIVALLTEQALRDLERQLRMPVQRASNDHQADGLVPVVRDSDELAAYALLEILRSQRRMKCSM